MHKPAWNWKEPLKVLASKDDPYLKSATAAVGAHGLEVHCSTAPEAPLEFRVFLDGKLVFEPGMVTPEASWYRFCQELGYHAEDHWDLDPALILFHQVLPALARDWGEGALPFDELGLPAGVVCLATVREAWNGAVAALQRGPEASLLGACFAALPLRAVVFQDDPGRRQDHVGTTVDDPLLGIFLHLGRSRQHRVTLAKAAINDTGGLRWSAWEPGGTWEAEGRAFRATQGPADFLRAAGLGRAVPPGFAAIFQAGIEGLAKVMDPVVEAYRRAYPAGIPWHRDPSARFLERTIVEARTEAGRQVLVLDDGTEVVVAETRNAEVTRVLGQEDA